MQWGFGRFDLKRGRRKRLGKEEGLGLGKCYCNLNSKSHNFFLFLEIGILSLALGMRSGPDPDLEPDPFSSPWTRGWALGTWRAEANMRSLWRLVLIQSAISLPAAQTAHLIDLLLNDLSSLKENHSFWLPTLLQELVQRTPHLRAWWSSLVPATLRPRETHKQTANEVFLKKGSTVVSFLECRCLPQSKEAEEAPLKHMSRRLLHGWVRSAPHPFLFSIK